LIATHKVRLTAAAVLLVAIVLPLSECQHRDTFSHAPKSVTQQLFPKSNADFSYQYAYKAVDFTWFGIVTALAYTWPIFFFALLEHSLRARLFIQPVELLLCVATLYWVRVLSFGGTYLYGAYVAAAVITFGFATFLVWWPALMAHTRRRTEGLEAAGLS